MQKKIMLRVSGMSCGSCAVRVRAALEAVEGVASAEVTVRPGSAAVVASDALDAEQLMAAVGPPVTGPSPAPPPGCPWQGRITHAVHERTDER